MTRLLTAQWIAPMDTPPIRDGGIVIDGERIAAVGATADLHRKYPEAVVEDLGDSIILPGLVNAHTHLELSDCRCGDLAGHDFVDWLINLISRTGLDPVKMTAAVERSVPIGIEQCLRFGVTYVGDISRQCQLTRPLLAASPLRAVSYGEVQAMAQRRDLLESRMAVAIDPAFAAERLRIGLTPHAPYSIEPAGYRRCLQVARERDLPLATHLAETMAEAAFLSDHSGPFRDLWDFLQRWDDDVPTFPGGPIRYAQSLGLLNHPTLLAHVNYCDDDELALLTAGKASVVYCPRTHRYFGHPPHRWREMLARGVNVAVGTDSCASSPDLNIVDDLRLLHEIAPDMPAHALWEMATIRAARAIRMADQIGSLAPGKLPDLAVFTAVGERPLQSILESRLLPERVYAGGWGGVSPFRAVVRKGDKG